MQAKRKLAALLLSLCMVLGMLPMTVFAAGETTAEGLVYEVNGESVTITGYTGNEASVVIPNEIEGKPVTAIGKAAFFNCGNLTSIEIPEGIESIGVQAFQLCKKLESVKIPASVISIEERAFQSCSNLDSVTFAEGSRLETINNFAFNDCGKLTSIEFPSGTKSIGNQAFTYCTSLTSIKIPSSVTTIGENAFQRCSNLSSVTFAEESQLKDINKSVFSYCSNLTSIEIPEGVETIGESAFYGCNKLKSITIPKTVTIIGVQAFNNCENLISVEFAEESRLTTIQSSAFSDCFNLTDDIEIPSTVTSIGEYAFYRCSKLSSMTFSRKTAPSIEENTFSGCSTLNIYVPCDGTGYAGNGWPEDKVKTLHNLDHLDAVPPTCTKDGTKEYWYCPDCGGYFLDKDGEIETDEAGIIGEKAIGHAWGEPVWSWSDDGKTAEVTFTCKNDSSHVEKPEVTITQEEKTPATCTEAGTTTYTAKVTFNGQEYTSFKDVDDIDPLGHKAEKVDGDAPTATEPGNIEYWYCPQCDTYFKDADLTEVITKEQMVLAPTGEAEPSKPEETPSALTDPPQDKPDKTDDTTESPQTGDSSNLALWIGLMLASCGVLGMLFYRRKKAAAGK